MHKKHILPSVAVALVACSVLALSGCQSSAGVSKGNTAATSIHKAASEINGVGSQLDTVLAALKDLAGNPQPDLRPQYKTFSSAVDKLAATAESVNKAAEAMSKKGNEYFATWEEELSKIQSESIRSKAEARKAEVTKALEQLGTDYQKVRESFLPVMTNLRDIQAYLGTDLTTAGIATLSDEIKKLETDVGGLRKSAGELVDHFKKVGAAISSVTAPPPLPPVPAEESTDAKKEAEKK